MVRGGSEDRSKLGRDGEGVTARTVRTGLLGLALVFPIHAGDLERSQIALLGSTGIDIASSWGLQERNPILGTGQFGWPQTGKAIGITVGLVLAERVIVKKFPASRRVLKWVNWAGAGAHGAAAVHNWRIRGLESGENETSSGDVVPGFCGVGSDGE